MVEADNWVIAYCAAILRWGDFLIKEVGDISHVICKYVRLIIQLLTKGQRALYL